MGSASRGPNTELALAPRWPSRFHIRRTTPSFGRSSTAFWAGSTWSISRFSGGEKPMEARPLVSAYEVLKAARLDAIEDASRLLPLHRAIGKAAAFQAGPNRAR